MACGLLVFALPSVCAWYETLTVTVFLAHLAHTGMATKLDNPVSSTVLCRPSSTIYLNIFSDTFDGKLIKFCIDVP